uniref:Uncharacterized protein n=1 Tax=Panagrolaimus superbus TaxID=310955 RepID=A0A914YI83_9BILA
MDNEDSEMPLLQVMTKKLNYHKTKAESLKEKNKDYETIIADLEKDGDGLDEKYDEITDLQNQNERFNEEIRKRDQIILELNDQLGNQNKRDKFYLKKSGKFTVQAHTCFSRLISQGNVAQDKVSIVILVVADLFKILVDAVPSRWTVGRDIHMVQSINCEYISTFIDECSNLSFLSDETTKFTKKLQAFVLTGKNDRTHQKFVLFLGVGEVPQNQQKDACMNLSRCFQTLV